MLAQLGGDAMKKLAHELAIRSEPLVEAAIRLCGWSAIVFVFAIFVFVFAKRRRRSSGALDLRGVVHERQLAAGLDRPSAVRHLALARRHGVGDGAGDGHCRCPSGSSRRSSFRNSAARHARESLKIVIELLAAIPSVVWGFIGYMVLNPLIIWATDAPIGINC